MAIEPNTPSNPSKFKKIFTSLAASIALLSPFNSNATEQIQNNLETKQSITLTQANLTSNYETNIKDPTIYALIKKINEKGFNVEIEGKPGRTEVLTIYNGGKPDTRFKPIPTKIGHKNGLIKFLEDIEFEEKETLDINNIIDEINSKGYKVLEIPRTAKFSSLILYKDKNQIVDENITKNYKKQTLITFLRLIVELEEKEKNEMIRYLNYRGYELEETQKTKDYVSLKLRNINENKETIPEIIIKTQDRNNTLRYLINELNKRR